jgi:hypothetical protein
MLDSIIFFRHVVTKKRIKVDLAKVEAIAEWKQPENVTEIRCFLGLVGYH